MLLHFGALPFSPLDQLFQVDPRQALGDLRYLLQRPPKSEFAGDPHRERLQLEETAQGRVAAHLTVQLQSTKLLACPRNELLEPRPLEPEPGDNPP